MKEKFFRLAKRMSLLSPSPYKIGCAIIKKRWIISLGFNNMTKTHPKATHPFKTLHAEMHALIGLSLEETKGATAYVYREYKDGSLAMSRPCDPCMLALKTAGIKRVCYTDSDGYKTTLVE